MQAISLNDINKVLDMLGISQTTLMIAAAVMMVLSLLVCFLGLKAIRILMAINGFLIGAGVGFGVADFMGMTTVISAVIAAIAGILVAVIAFNLYIAVIFLGVWAGVALAVIEAVSKAGILKGIALYVVGAVAGLVIGIIVLKIAEIVIIIFSSIGGGFSAAACAVYLLPIDMKLLIVILGAVLSVLGLIVQFAGYRKKRKQKVREKEAVKREIKSSKEAQVEEAMNILDLDDDDDFDDDDDL